MPGRERSGCGGGGGGGDAGQLDYTVGLLPGQSSGLVGGGGVHTSPTKRKKGPQVVRGQPQSEKKNGSRKTENTTF